MQNKSAFIFIVEWQYPSRQRLKDTNKRGQCSMVNGQRFVNNQQLKLKLL